MPSGSDNSSSNFALDSFLSFFEHCLDSVFLLPIPVSLDSQRLYQFSSKLLGIHDLVWQSFELLSISSLTTQILWMFFFHKVNFVKTSRSV